MSESCVHGEKIVFSYDEDPNNPTLKNIDVEIRKGEFIAILGQNGSGKTSLAKLFNALLLPQSGSLKVLGMDSKDEKLIWQLRRKCGMVFQNPDNQFVSTIIEEDVAFGLENYEVPREEIPAIVTRSLKLCGMDGYEKRSPHSLSGGQKQRVALAGILALDSDLLVFDEATAMLDPQGRGEILGAIKNIHSTKEKTIIMITHLVEEAVHCDRVFIMKDGTIKACGTPREILTDMEVLKDAGLLPPVSVRLYYDLKKEGVVLNKIPLHMDELVGVVCSLV